MIIKASGRSALILAAGLAAWFAGPSYGNVAGVDTATAAARPDSATPAKTVKPASRQLKRTAHRKSGKVAKSVETKPSAGTDVADASGETPMVIPASVANANAELRAVDTPGNGPGVGNPDSAKAMSAKANTMLLAAADKPFVVAQANPDQLNDVDRALQQNPAQQPPPAAQAQPSPTVAMAPAKAAPTMAAGNGSSTWDETSLIGKIFIGFGALLTMASAARMFMA